MARDGEQQLFHINNNILCAVRISKSGPIPRIHDLVEICVLPINNKWEPSNIIVPFCMSIMPKRKENIDYESCPMSKERILKICTDGMESFAAADRFDEWFGRLNLNRKKKIVVLAHDWNEDREFLIDWLGVETFVQFFDPGIRDIRCAALYANDRADFHIEQCPYPKTYLKYLSTTLKYYTPRTKDILEEAKMLIEVYRRMLKNSRF